MRSTHPPSSGQLTAGTGTVLRLLRVALHAAFLGLLAIASARAFSETSGSTRTGIALAGVLLLAALYVAGPLTQARWPRWQAALVWLAATTAAWAALLLFSPDFSWVAFPLFFLHLHLLRGVHALLAVGVLTTAVVATQTLHSGAVTVPIVLGPVLGAVFAVVIAMGYAALYTENEQRRHLIEDLTATRDELARSQHAAGVLTERERLAREIHDTLAQGLSSIVLLLRAAENALPDSPTVGRDRVVDARNTASDNLTEVRRFVRDLTPPALTTDSLPAALGRLCERTGRNLARGCHFHLDGTPTTLPSAHQSTLLRAAQASLANVVTHAGATTAVVSLAYLDTEVTLDIADNGVGFTPQAPAHIAPDGTGYGLRALRARVEDLGGRVEIETRPGGGAIIAIALPMTGAEEGA